VTPVLTGRRAAARLAGAGLPERLQALTAAADVADGRLEPDAVAAARAVTARADERLRLGVGHTLVALAGATGSGKSTLFNSLTGAELSTAGVRRPTTATAHACVWGADEAAELLDWAGVRRRHRLPAPGEADTALDGLVLLDLPDHDSTEVSHRLEVDRLVELVDLLVWVLDPQKYADAAVHERYLRPLAGHAGVMLVALNQVDRLGAAECAACLSDLRRLLVADGLGDVRLVATSGRTGAGIAELREVLAERVQARQAAVARLSADVARAARRMAADGCDAIASAAPPAAVLAAPGVTPADHADLIRVLATAAGVDTVVRAVERSHRAGGAKRTGWPFIRWVGRLRPDPLRRLHLGGPPTEAVRTSLPPASPAQRAEVANVVRNVADRSADGLPAVWSRRVRQVAAGADADLPDRLDRAVAGTEVRPGPAPRWWGTVGALQTVLALTIVLGALWLLALFALDYLRLPQLPLPHLGPVPLPTVLLVGGAVAGLLLALLARIANGAGARRRAARARRNLTERVAAVADDAVVAPLEAELSARTELCAALAVAGADPPR
jgi:GTP-binding protein EngB required for normal cell division